MLRGTDGTREVIRPAVQNWTETTRLCERLSPVARWAGPDSQDPLRSAPRTTTIDSWSSRIETGFLRRSISIKTSRSLTNAIAAWSTRPTPNQKTFFSRGGKLMMYHGWNDPLIAPRNSINYYTSVTKGLGGSSNVADSMRLFMVPEMSHCSGDNGTNTFDDMKALEQWVERKAPEQIVVSRVTNGVADRTRPLCPYPQIAQHAGTGNIDEASSFICR